MIRIAIVAALLFPAAAMAQDNQGETGQPPQRIRSVEIKEGQPCPKSEGNEVVVCSTIKPGEEYRIPKALRDSGPIPAQNQSWVNTVATQDDISRRAAGLPDTCSPVGTGGQSGCARKANDDYAADRRARKRAAESIP